MSKIGAILESIWFFINKNEILKVYEKKENDRDIVIQTTLPLSFKKEDNEIENYIKELNFLELTPIDAINILNDLKMKVKDNER